MRILKRNLAFMLAMIMALSLTAFAGYEDYPDVDELTYVEAVDVLTELGIVEGSNGELLPTGNLTRAQAAKLIAYTMLGKKAADALQAEVAPFVDVPTYHWAAGYVEYCADQGIVGGMGDGTFVPEANVTASQFAKMLLCAVGYGEKGEFTGASWDSTVNSQATKLGVFDENLDVVFANAVTREEAFLYTFNALTKVMEVTYSADADEYYAGTVFNSIKGFDFDETLGAKLYNLKTKAATDVWGRDSYNWYKGAKKIAGMYHEDANATYTAAVKSSVLFADLDLDETTKATVIRNGEKQANFQIKKNDSTKIGGNGVLLEAYVDEDMSVTLIMIDTYLAKVTNIRNDDVTLKAWIDLDGTTETMTVETSMDLEEGDYVLVTIADDEIQTIAMPEEVNGKLTKRGLTSTYATLEETKYNYAAKLDKTQNVEESVYVVNYDDEMVMMLDEYGYMIALMPVAKTNSIDGYVLVTDSEVDAGSLASADKALVEVMWLDGTGFEVLNLQTRRTTVSGERVTQWKDVDGAWVTIADDADNMIEYGFYGYTMTEDGEIVLKSLCTGKRTEAEILSKAASATGDYVWGKDETATITANGKQEIKFGSNEVNLVMDNETVLNLVTAKDVEVVEGYKNIKLNLADVDALVVYSGRTISEIYVVDGNLFNTEYGYYNGTELVEATKLGKAYVSLYVDGALVEYDFTDLYNNQFGKKAPTEGVYEIEVEDGVLTKMEAVKYEYYHDATVEEDRAKNFDIKYLPTKDVAVEMTGEVKYLTYADGVEIYDLTDDAAVLDAVAEGDTIVFVENETADGDVVTHIWVLAHYSKTNKVEGDAVDYTLEAGISTKKGTGEVAYIDLLDDGVIADGAKLTVKAFGLIEGEYAYAGDAEWDASANCFYFTAKYNTKYVFKMDVNGETVVSNDVMLAK